MQQVFADAEAFFVKNVTKNYLNCVHTGRIMKLLNEGAKIPSDNEQSGSNRQPFNKPEEAKARRRQDVNCFGTSWLSAALNLQEECLR